MTCKRLSFVHCLKTLGRLPVAAVLIVFLGFLTSGSTKSCSAQSVFDWTNTTSSSAFWDLNNNWLQTGRPGGGDTASFTNNATYEVWWDAFTTTQTPDVGFIDILLGDVTFLNRNSTARTHTVNGVLTLSGKTTQLTDRGLHLSVAGATQIVNGASLSIDGSHAAGSQFSSANTFLTEGLLTFDNAATGTFSGPVEINVNNANAATMHVLGGSQVTANAIRIGNGASQFATSAGTLNVNGPVSSLVLDGTSNFVIGNSNGLGQHVVNVTDGGLLDINLNGSAAMQIEASGALKIDNASMVHNQSGTIFRVDGEFDIANGGSMTSVASEVSIAHSSGTDARARISGSGTVWNNTGTMGVGLGGNGSLDILGGGVVNNNGDANISSSSGSGLVTVNGPSSQWNVSQNLGVGGTDESGSDLLQIENGGLVTSASSTIGNFDDGVGSVTVTGIGSRWENSSFLHVGDAGNGVLTVENGGVVTAANSEIRFNGVATISGSGQWNNSTNSIVDGIVSVDTGGIVTGFGTIGSSSGANGEVTVSGAGSRWNSGELDVGKFGNGTFTVEAGGQVNNSFSFLGRTAGTAGAVIVTDTGSQWNTNFNLKIGDVGNGSLIVAEGGVVNNGFGIIASESNSTSLATVTGTGSQWNTSGILTVGNRGNGTLNVLAEGVVNSDSGSIADKSASTGVAKINGIGSQWNNNSLKVGGSGQGTLSVEAGGLVSSNEAIIAGSSSSTGLATITGAGSQWNNSGNLLVGGSGDGTLIVESGGLVTNGFGFIGTEANSIGLATVSGAGSQWTNSENLSVGNLGQGTLNIENGGLVTVGGTTSINSQSAVNLGGGRFEFGTTTHDDLTRINATSGSIAGTINVSGINDVASFSALQNPLVDLTDVNVVNSGLLVGSAILGSSLENQSGGEMLTSLGQQAIFVGGLTNSGEINNTGGTVRFEQTVTNNASGFVGGRGVFGAGDGWTNEGVMAFSGTTDILGDVENTAGGQIVTSGGATTTFFDDLVHNGAEIRTSAGSNTVIFGAASGAGSYTGTGTVFFEGDLRPGNSPAVVDFEGSVVFGDSLFSEFELAGTQFGQFDRLNIDRDLFLGGELAVSLIDGFQLGTNQEFLIADVGGSRFGLFDGLDEGGLIGNFGGQDLFITYNAGSNGSGVALFTGVPEPNALCLLVFANFALFFRRRRSLI